MRSHRFKTPVIAAGMIALIGFSAGARAHNPMCECKDIGGGLIRCSGGFSDGSGAPGVASKTVTPSLFVVTSNVRFMPSSRGLRSVR